MRPAAIFMRFTCQTSEKMCDALNKKEIVRLKEIVYDIDPRAFMIVMDAREVLGEGFLKYE